MSIDKIMRKIVKVDRKRHILAAQSLADTIRALRALGGGYEVPRVSDGAGNPLPADDMAPITLVSKALNHALWQIADDRRHFMMMKRHIEDQGDVRAAWKSTRNR